MFTNEEVNTNLHLILAALAPASAEDTENYALGANALVGRLENGEVWGFYYEDNGAGSSYPTLTRLYYSGPVYRLAPE